MKMPLLLRIQESLASRISLWVVLCVVVILTATAFLGNYYVVKSIKLEESVKANGILYIVGQRIDAALISVEVAVRNHLNDIKENLNETDELYSITQRMLEDNPTIVGSAIAFKPNYFPEKGVWFSPYSYREGGTIRSKQLGSADYDYHKMDWYQTTDSLKHDFWSDPYFDKGGGEMLMTTYSCPVTDEAGNFIAVVTADILLDDLSKLLDVDYYENAYACMIGRSGTFISHPIKDLVLQQNVFKIAKEMGHPELIEVAQEMIDGKSGMRKWHSPTFGDSYIFFVPFEHTGWSMAIVCKASELFKGVRKTELFLVVLFILMLVLLTYILWRSVHRLIAPLTAFAQAADEVAQGNLQAMLPDVRSKDEMQRLHHSFSIMQQSLVSQMEELKQVNEAKGRIEGELKVARDIQLSMLPKVYTPTAYGKDLDIYGQQISAKEVGGDLYDFFIRDEKLFFCIGDVSGKGVPAALVMAMTLSQFRNVVSYENDLEKIIKSINKNTCDGNDASMFVTFFVGVLDLPTGLLNYCNAGHNKPFIVTDIITELPAKPDLPLGVSEEAGYVVREYTVPPGAMLFLYTDGLTEAMNGQRELFGRERLIDNLKNEEDCKSLIEKMIQAVHQFVDNASQSDDLTMLAIRSIVSQKR
ncbi:MAG: SpoIIE family protein phosphatase [Bacteroidaceae bacterium]|nr:SpoIIE family protein phosphatase [Bacteroidaceae bacterium]